jgi:Skp family chaperone for outer membrane proteins
LTVHPETQYLIDGALEHGDFTALEHAALHLVPQVLASFEAQSATGKFTFDLPRNLARDYLANCSLDTRRALALHTAPIVQDALGLFHGRVDFAIQTKVQNDLGVGSDDALATGFAAPSYLSEDGGPNSPKCVFASDEDVCAAKVLAWVAERFSASLALWKNDLEVVREALAWAQEAGAERARQLMATVGATPPQEEDVATLVAIARKAQERDELRRRRQTKAARKPIKRVLKLFERMGRTRDVSLLVSGQEVVLHNPNSDLQFCLKPYQGDWLTRRTTNASGHSPFEIHLQTKSGVHIAQLCVYFKDTPVLDQLLALTMFVDTGNEEELLGKANWFNPGERAQVFAALRDNHPTLLGKVGLMPWADGPEEKDARAPRIVLPRLFTEQERHWRQHRESVRQWLNGFFTAQGLPYQAAPQAPALAA